MSEIRQDRKQSPQEKVQKNKERKWLEKNTMQITVNIIEIDILMLVKATTDRNTKDQEKKLKVKKESIFVSFIK